MVHLDTRLSVGRRDVVLPSNRLKVEKTKSDSRGCRRVLFGVESRVIRPRKLSLDLLQGLALRLGNAEVHESKPDRGNHREYPKGDVASEKGYQVREELKRGR